MVKSEKEVGESVKRRRESSLMSQQDLAAAMRQRGYKWSQATVWSVEAGERPLRYTESLELGEICGFGSDNMDRFQEGFQRGLELSRQAIERITSA